VSTMKITATSTRFQQLGKQRARGQAVVETALMGILLAMLLAASIDFGRAFYTAVVVTNMAGEGAAFAAEWPHYDTDSSSCSVLTPDPNMTIQQRARRVAKDRGLVIEEEDQRMALITVTTYDSNGQSLGSSCTVRCTGRKITVRVTYTLNDLFLPRMLGFTSIPITRSASEYILYDVEQNGDCGGS
jgi:Flp pilus assembly protein TadG